MQGTMDAFMLSMAYEDVSVAKHPRIRSKKKFPSSFSKLSISKQILNGEYGREVLVPAL